MDSLEVERMKSPEGVSIMCGDIDRSESDALIADGTAYDCVNLRRESGMLSIVGDGQVIREGLNPFGTEDLIFSHHVSLNEGTLLVAEGSNIYTLSDTLEKSLAAAIGSKVVKLSTFGNIVIVNTVNGVEYLIYKPKQKEFQKVSFDAVMPKARMVVDFDVETWNPKEVVVTYDKATRDLKIGEYYLETERLKSQKDIMEGSCWVILGLKLFDGSVIMQSTPTYLTAGSAQHKPDANWVAFARCGTSDDGAIGVKFNIDTLRKGDATSLKFYGLGFTKMAFQVLGVNTVEFNKLKLAGVVQGVVAYATRPTSNYKIEDTILKNIDSTTLYTGEQRLKVDLAGALPLDEPFYLVEDNIILETTTTLGAKKFENLTDKEVLHPNFSRHQLSYDGAKAYNERLHLWGTTQLMCEAESNIVSYNQEYFNNHDEAVTVGVDKELRVRPDKVSAGRPAVIEMEVDLVVDGKALVVRTMIDSKMFYYKFSRRWAGQPSEQVQLQYLLMLPEVFGYPDSRATEIRLYACIDNLQSCIFTRTLTPYHAINQSLVSEVSYNRAYARRLEPTPISLGSETYYLENGSTPSDSAVISNGIVLNFEPRTRVAGRAVNNDFNKLYVSEFNNPFYINPANVYTIGGDYNNITAIEPAIEQLSEGRFGYYPLYVLSKEGIWALESGENIVYQSVQQVSLDRSISSSCIAGVGNGVVFLSSKGLMFVSGRSVKEIGKPITSKRRYKEVMEEVVSLSPEFKPLMEGVDVMDFLKGATASVISSKGEVIFTRTDSNFAYVCDVDSASFYRRTLKGQVFKAGSQLLLAECTSETLKFSDIEQHVKTAKPFLWVSRPIKLGQLAYKKLAYAILRISSENAAKKLTWTIFGSIDGREYKPINMVSTNGELEDLQMGRARTSVRYFAIAITGEADAVSIDNQDIYTIKKFYHRPR